MFQYLCIWNFQQPLNILPLLIPRFISIWLYAFIITEKFRLSQKKQWYETSPHCIHNVPHMVYIDFINGHLQASRFTSHFYLITFQSNLMTIQQYLCIYYSNITCLLLSYQLYSQITTADTQTYFRWVFMIDGKTLSQTKKNITPIFDVIKNKLCLLVHSEYLTFLITCMPYRQLSFLIVI